VADIEITIEREGFATVLLDQDGISAYGLQENTQGFGMGPVIGRFREGAGDGAVFDGDRVGMKPVDVGLIIRGSNRLELGANIRALRNIMRARPNKPLPRLVATWANGDVYQMPFAYESGLEVDYKKALNHVFTTVVGLSCPDPFWVARDALEFKVENDGAGTPFLDDLSGLPTSSSTTDATLTVDNPGDVGAFVTTVVYGPTSGNVTVTINGVGWTFETPLDTDDVITLAASRTGITVTDQTGTNRYPDLASAPRFPQLDDGSNTVNVTMVGATPASRVSGFFKPRLEGIY
jgi:hypothetical protein